MESNLEEITLAELLEMAMTSRQIDLHVSMPAIVQSYSTLDCTVDVVPVLNRAVPDGVGGWISERLPKLSAIPVVFPRSKAFSITFPLQAGDSGLVVFCERSIGVWRATGNQSDPGDLGLHTLDGAVFVPGLYADASPPQHADGSKMVLGSEDSDAARIVIGGDGIIRAGATAANFVAMADKVLSELQSIATAFAMHKHIGVVNGVQVSGVAGDYDASSPPKPIPIPPYIASAVASSNLKADD